MKAKLTIYFRHCKEILRILSIPVTGILPVLSVAYVGQPSPLYFLLFSHFLPLTLFSPPPPLPPSGQEKLLCLSEGLLSNTRLPRHSGLRVYVSVCLSACARVYSSMSTSQAQHCCSGIWEFYSTLSFGKHTLWWAQGWVGCMFVCVNRCMCMWSFNHGEP